jgi:predicted TIM-barrel fold metal-dependent hydrolase
LLDLSDLEMIDFHIHNVDRTLISDMIDARSIDHMNLMKVKEGKVRTHLLAERRKEMALSPLYHFLVRYIAEVYGCRPTLNDVDKVLKEKYRGDFEDYIRSILDRENVAWVQLVSPTPDVGAFPKERYKWALQIDHLLQPGWVMKKEAKTIDRAAELLEEEIEAAVTEGCVGLKNSLAYYRGLDVKKRTQTEASAAYKALLTSKPPRVINYYGKFDFPIYEKAEDIKNLEAVEDYLLKAIMLKAGELGLSVHFHTGGGVGPGTDLRKHNPVLLYGVFYDEDIINAGTKIVILHAGVPFIGEAAAAASSFPHVYVDTSWPTRTEIVRDIFRHCLREASPSKILYGTDAAWVPERIGQGARSARVMMADVLEEYRKYGWTEGECIEAAKMVFSENAKKLLVR